MYVINEQTKIVNIWADTDINRQRLASGKYGVVEYKGEIETVDNTIYAKGYAPAKPEPTKEEQQKARQEAYIAEVDPITCHINRLKDEEQTPEVIAEIASLVEERKAKVEEIKQRFPYPVEETEEVI